MSKLVFGGVRFNRIELQKAKSKDELKAMVAPHWANRKQSVIDSNVGLLWEELQNPIVDAAPKEESKVIKKK
jgi:hypothetical protein